MGMQDQFLEYGTNKIEMHMVDVQPNDRSLILQYHRDLLRLAGTISLPDDLLHSVFGYHVRI